MKPGIKVLVYKIEDAGNILLSNVVARLLVYMAS
jgi:hypothetical protein